jgi:outer membrane receptor protein involved in Fe transport
MKRSSKFRRNQLVAALGTVLVPSLGGGIAQAQQLEEVVVTATKRAASTQDIAVSVTALTGESLEQFGISNFEDYLIQLPGVTAGGSGPGQNTIYIRGVASTTPNLTTAGVAGLAPNVALYLDEQPLSQPGRNLDVYAADLNRVEVLKGPQGTLFGASSQAGTVRLITNKPDFSEAYGRVKADVSYTEKGEESTRFEAMYNLPVSDRVAVRAVVYRDDQGGWVDNVPGTISAAESARWRDAGYMRTNGVPVSPRRAGLNSATYINSIPDAVAYTSARIPFDPNDPNSLVEFREANNEDLVEKDFNDTVYTGGRISARVEVNEDWSLLLGAMTQELEADGTFTADPTLGTDSPSIQRYSPYRLEDSFDNFNWTIEGRIGELELVYTGAYTERESDQIIDYTDYMFVGQYLPYYICDASVTYPEYSYYQEGAPLNQSAGTCYEPDLYALSYSETEVTTHEFRFSTDQSKDMRLTAGAFYSDLQLEERVDFSYPSINKINFFDFYPGGGIPIENYPFPGSVITEEGPYPDDTVFRNDVRRTDEQFGIFGELSYDFTDQLSATVGARYYDVRVDLEGGANATFCNPFFANDQNAFGTDISDLYDGDGSLRFVGDCSTNPRLESGITADEAYALFESLDPYSVDRGKYVNGPNAISRSEVEGFVRALDAPEEAKASGTIVKVTLDYKPSDDVLWYLTYSEGFRPGLLNRPGGAAGPGTYSVPFELATDDVTNYELGWKADLMGGTLRFNGSAFFVEIERLQTTIFDPSITNLFFSDNAANAEVMGLEGEVTWLPQSIAGLTVGASFSLLDTEITEVLTPTDDVRKGDSLAFAPEQQFNANARYTWGISNGLDGHLMANIAYSSESYSDIITINRDRIQSWTMLGVSAGVSNQDWDATLYVDNLTDERAELARNYVNDRPRATYARPRTMGLRLSYNF